MSLHKQSNWQPTVTTLTPETSERRCLIYTFGPINYSLDAMALVLEPPLATRQIFLFTTATCRLDGDMLYLSDTDLLLRLNLVTDHVHHIDLHKHNSYAIDSVEDHGDSATLTYQTRYDYDAVSAQKPFHPGYPQDLKETLPSGLFIGLTARETMLEHLHTLHPPH